MMEVQLKCRPLPVCLRTWALALPLGYTLFSCGTFRLCFSGLQSKYLNSSIYVINVL